MDERSMENELMRDRIQLLEQGFSVMEMLHPRMSKRSNSLQKFITFSVNLIERNNLHKEIEELCIQKAGPDFINFATQTYFRRTAGLEQEVENLQKKLADCCKENYDVKDKLSQAVRIKTHLDQLHKLEISKNREIVKQLDDLRVAVATAFADRDRALVEAEKAKENEEVVCQKLKDAETRLQELSVGLESKEKELNLQMNLEKQQQEIENYRKVIDKFYEIRQHACSMNNDDGSNSDDQFENVSWDEQLACLLNDPTESWSFNVNWETYSANYVAELHDEVDMLQVSVSDLQNKLEMEFETEKCLKNEISIMKHEKILSDRHIIDEVSSLRDYHDRQKIQIIELLDNERSFQQSAISSIDQTISLMHENLHAAEVSSCSTTNPAQVADISESLAQALQEKMSALILLPNQERHVWEENVHSAVQDTIDELQKYLKLASEGKVKALVELAEVKQQYQQLLEKNATERLQGSLVADSGDGKVARIRRDGTFKSLWKQTSRRLLGTEEKIRDLVRQNSELERFPNNQTVNHSTDIARLQNEYASLKQSVHELERWTLDVRKLRLSVLQAKMRGTVKGALTSNSRLLDETIKEAESLKNALSSTLPLSWSVEADMSSSTYVMVDENAAPEDDKIDPVLVAGLEMVELLIMAARILNDKESKK